MGAVDAKSMKGMLHAYCGSAIQGDLDVPKLLKDALDYTPSFIAEACNRSLLYAMSRNGKDEAEIKVTTADLSDAMKGLRSQFELMSKTVEDEITMETKLRDLVKKELEAGQESLASHVEDLSQSIASIRDYIEA